MKILKLLAAVSAVVITGGVVALFLVAPEYRAPVALVTGLVALAPVSALLVLLTRRLARLQKIVGRLANDVRSVRQESRSIEAARKQTEQQRDKAVERGLADLRRFAVDARAFTIATLEDVADLDDGLAALHDDVAGVTDTLDHLASDLTRIDDRTVAIFDRTVVLSEISSSTETAVGDLGVAMARAAEESRRSLQESEQRTASTLRAIDAYRYGDSLPALGGWAMSPDAAVLLVELFGAKRPHTIVETGSGSSTALLGRLLQLSGAGHVYALEHDQRFGAESRRIVRARGLGDWATVVDAPLVSYGGFEAPWYDISTFEVTGVEMLLVDGPPAATGMMARYLALPMLWERLAPGAVVLLDDAGRADERIVVERWIDEFEWAEHRAVETERGVHVFVKAG